MFFGLAPLLNQSSQVVYGVVIGVVFGAIVGISQWLVLRRYLDRVGWWVSLTLIVSLAPWGRPLTLAAAGVFFISLAFPVIAGLTKDTSSFPKWWGVLDVGIAFILAILAFVITALAQGKVNKVGPTNEIILDSLLLS